MNLQEIKDYAEKNWVPILRDKSANFLCKLIDELKPKNILEIGTCIGYSGILMLNACKESFLTTIEIDKNRALQALKNFKEAKLHKRVTLINEDAKMVISKLLNQGKRFDFILLDGPKGQYINYLPILKKLIAKGGVIFADDILYHGMVKEGYPKHKHRTIIFRLREFIDQITHDNDLKTQIYEIEDGFSVSYRK